MNTILVILGTEKGAFFLSKSRNRVEWQEKGPFLKGWKVHDVMVAPEKPLRMYAAMSHFVFGPSIQKSEDGGETWQALTGVPQYEADSGQTINAIWTLVSGSGEASTKLYAGVDEAGLFVSEDDGNSWRELKGLSKHPTRAEWMGGAGGLCCHSVQVHPENPDRIWVGISAVGVLRSDDGGTTWQLKNDGLEKVVESESFEGIVYCVHRLVMDPRNPDRLFQQNHRGVFRSRDGGDSWERIENGLPGTFGFPMAMSPKNSNELYTIPLESDEFRIFPQGQLTVYRSQDGGDSWQPLTSGLPNNIYTGVLRQALTVSDEGSVVFGTSSGQVYFSEDRGENWQPLPGTYPRIYSVTTCTLD